jgi:hypothetical protein
MRWTSLCLLVACGGCSSLFGIGDPKEAPPSTCLLDGLDLCSVPPDGPITFGADRNLDTTYDCTRVVYDPAGNELCVIAATDLEISASITTSGPIPIVFAATGTITIHGTVDASSHSLMRTGPGAIGCKGANQVRPLSGGGGAGGSLQGRGGNGGNSTAMAVAGIVAPPPEPLPRSLRGGCPGSSISLGVTGTVAGAGGDATGIVFGPGYGGGAVGLVAGESIEIAAGAAVMAGGGGGGPGGSGGAGGGAGSGGAGGGSGGMIVLAAPVVRVAGVLAANGGGGGASGGQGQDAQGKATAAQGGAASTTEGIGGNGAAGASLDGAAGASGGTSGGGGGGGAGFITITGTTVDTTAATISPAPTTP